MKNCPQCNAQLDDSTVFCPNCGYNFGGHQFNAAPADPFDHTAEYDPKDISDNKVIAMITYLLGPIGIIIALLASHDSPYVKFHLRQSLKMWVCLILSAFANIIPLIGQIAFAVCSVIIFVLEIIAFFQVCKGQAKEPAIIKKFGFLK